METKLFVIADTANVSAEGTGLGLSIVRDAVESVGGRAWAEFPGKGSIFAFSLPFRRDVGPDDPRGTGRVHGRREADVVRETAG